MQDIAIIGGGAAGCFCAIEIKRRMPQAAVTIYEAGTRTLAKLALTGGGHCNFTNTFQGIRSLKEAYPRGEQLMKRALKVFSNDDTVEWFRREGIEPRIQEDQRIFPASMDAMEIVRTLQRLMRELGVEVRTGSRIGNISDISADAIVLTAGGQSTERLQALTAGIGLKTEESVPSLFTFNIPDRELTRLMGASAPEAILSIPGTKFRAEGPLLITDWGLSGPATLRLSSYAARHLAEKGYRAPLCVNWCALGEDELRENIISLTRDNLQKLLSSVHPAELPSRIWTYLLKRSGLRADLRCCELGSKGLNRLCATVCSDNYNIEGRSRFKDEFVTCGGVSLESVNPATLECKNRPGLYFAGEVLDIDAVTGGFNLQAAWSTAMIVAQSISSKR